MGAVMEVGNIEAFRDLEPDKELLHKLLEEAAEVYGAWDSWDKWRGLGNQPTEDALRERAIDEVADVIQAACNVAAAMGVVDFAPYMGRCHERNAKRGRYR